MEFDVALWRQLGEIKNGPSRRGDRVWEEGLSGRCRIPNQFGLGNVLPHSNRPRS